MRDLLERLLGMVRDEGNGPLMEIWYEGQVLEGNVLVDMEELIEDIREHLANGGDD